MHFSLAFLYLLILGSNLVFSTMFLNSLIRVRRPKLTSYYLKWERRITKSENKIRNFCWDGQRNCCY